MFYLRVVLKPPLPIIRFLHSPWVHRLPMLEPSLLVALLVTP